MVDEIATARPQASTSSGPISCSRNSGLADRAGNLPSQLSGGQKQRVAIGRSLMNEPALVLFDEPTSALDTKLGDQMVELIREEMKSRGTAAIIVTHDDRITRYADRTVHITDGRISA